MCGMQWKEIFSMLMTLIFLPLVVLSLYFILAWSKTVDADPNKKFNCSKFTCNLLTCKADLLTVIVLIPFAILYPFLVIGMWVGLSIFFCQAVYYKIYRKTLYEGY